MLSSLSPAAKKVVVSIFLALANFLSYADRTNMSVCIIVMAQQYGWNNSTQGVILSSFFVGYLLTQVLGGLLSELLNGKVVLFSGVALWSAFTLMTPIAAHLSYQWHTIAVLYIIRVGMGAGEGVNFPAVYNICGKWLQPKEKSRYMAFIASGMEIGTLSTTFLAPIITMYLGWEWVFYFFGVLGLIWAFFFALLLPEKPPVDPSSNKATQYYTTTVINADGVEETQQFVAEQTPTAETTAQHEPETSKIRVYLKMLVTPAVWGIVIAHTCFNYCWYVLLSWLPKYFTSLHVPFDKIGYITNLPYISTLIFSNVAGFISDMLITRGNLPVALVRKICQMVSFLGSAFFLVMLRFTNGNITLATICVCMATACGAFCRVGYNINHLDIAPKYAGVLMGITNTVATIPGIVGNITTGWILDVSGGNWNVVFSTVAAVNIIGALSFFILAKGHVIFK